MVKAGEMDDYLDEDDGDVGIRFSRHPSGVLLRCEISCAIMHCSQSIALSDDPSLHSPSDHMCRCLRRRGDNRGWPSPNQRRDFAGTSSMPLGAVRICEHFFCGCMQMFTSIPAFAMNHPSASCKHAE